MDISLSAIEAGEGLLLTAFIRDITERQAAADLQRSLAERRALLEHLVSAGEEERERIASNIHDDSIQAITAAGIRLQTLRRELDDPKQLDLLADLEETIQLSISRLRHLLFELRPPALDREGLAAALRMYLNESRDQSPTTFRLEDKLRSQPDDEARSILYRIAQEALTNVRKHAHASEAEVLVREDDGGFVVRITDDGVGFAPEQTVSVPGHLGLAAMRERAELAGGRIRIDSAPRTGTVVECWIPSLPRVPARRTGARSDWTRGRRPGLAPFRKTFTGGIRMSTVAEQQRLSVTFRLWTVLADPAVRIAIAASGLAAAVGGGLLLATSDHLLHPVAYGLQVAIIIVGAVAAALVWLTRRPVSAIAPMLLVSRSPRR